MKMFARLLNSLKELVVNMSRIRTVKPEFFKHEELYEAEVEEKLPLRLAFVGLWCCCDREGRFKWRPNQLKLDVLPYDKCDFSRVLDALATRGFIVEYTSEEGEKYGFVPSFLVHQVINNRESQSQLPCPFDASSTRDPRGLSMHKGKGKERKGKEGNTSAAKSEKQIVEELNLEKQLAEDFIRHRKNKSAPITETAIAGLKKQAEKAGITISDAIRICIERNWQGFNADWYQGKPTEQATQQTTRKVIGQI